MCGQKVYASGLYVVSTDSFDLSLLANEHIPDHLVLDEYDFVVYCKAILCHHGLSNRYRIGHIQMCSSCHWCLVDRGRQPPNALANFQYYAHGRLSLQVCEAFRCASREHLEKNAGVLPMKKEN